MDFRLPAAVAEARGRMLDFVRSELVPRERDLPAFSSVLPAADQAEILARLRAAGLWALAVPREFGGGGLGFIGLCALREAMGHSTLWTLARLLGTEPPILLYGANLAQQQTYLLPTIAGQRYGCFALTEPDAGSDAANIQLTATPDGPNHYRLNGGKIFTSHADEADYALVFGRSEPGSRGGQGISLFLVDRDLPGFSLVRQIDTMGGDRPSELRFEDCRVPASAIVGTPGQAFDLAQRWFACDRVCLQPPVIVGACARALSMALADGVAGPAEVGPWAVQVHAARQMLYHAAWKADAGQDMRHEASLVKATASTLGIGLLDAAMGWYGPAGYSRALPLERYYRDVRRFAIAAGTVEIQQFVIARGLLRGYAQTDCVG